MRKHRIDMPFLDAVTEDLSAELRRRSLPLKCLFLENDPTCSQRIAGLFPATQSTFVSIGLNGEEHAGAPDAMVCKHHIENGRSLRVSVDAPDAPSTQALCITPLREAVAASGLVGKRRRIRRESGPFSAVRELLGNGR